MTGEIKQIACSKHGREFMAYPFGLFSGPRYIQGGFGFSCEEAIANLVDHLERDTTFSKLANSVEIIYT